MEHSAKIVNGTPCRKARSAIGLDRPPPPTTHYPAGAWARIQAGSGPSIAGSTACAYSRFSPDSPYVQVQGRCAALSRSLPWNAVLAIEAEWLAVAG